MAQDIYAALGVNRIIDAHGTSTRLGGGLLAQEVTDAMAAAARGGVEMPDIQARPPLRPRRARRRRGAGRRGHHAAQLPPVRNLRRFVAEGADLVCHSAGNAIGLPQASGILAGRRDLVSSALVRMLDRPPHGIGRVAKEEITGLITTPIRFAPPWSVRKQRAAMPSGRMRCAGP